jgi:hypothetical protein
VFVSKWASEGMHRSLAKQDTLGTQTSFHISLLWTKCLLLTYPWQIHTNLFRKTHCNTWLRIAFPITDTSNILKLEAAENTRRAACVEQRRAERGVQTPPPEIPKFWQSWAELPIPWKIHLKQPNRNTGFTHLQIERNLWLAGDRPQISVASALCP